MKRLSLFRARTAVSAGSAPSAGAAPMGGGCCGVGLRVSLAIAPRAD